MTNGLSKASIIRFSQFENKAQLPRSPNKKMSVQ